MLHISQINEFIKQSSQYADIGYESLVEMIWRYYTMRNSIDSEAINAGFLEIETMIGQLSQKRKRRLMRLIGDLCVEYERVAFIEGVRVGSRLMIELWDGEKRVQKPDSNR